MLLGGWLAVKDIAFGSEIMGLMGLMGLMGP